MSTSKLSKYVMGWVQLARVRLHAQKVERGDFKKCMYNSTSAQYVNQCYEYKETEPCAPDDIHQKHLQKVQSMLKGRWPARCKHQTADNSGTQSVGVTPSPRFLTTSFNTRALGGHAPLGASNLAPSSSCATPTAGRVPTYNQSDNASDVPLPRYVVRRAAAGHDLKHGHAQLDDPHRQYVPNAEEDEASHRKAGPDTQHGPHRGTGAGGAEHASGHAT